MANKTSSCEGVCINGVYPRLDPQVFPIGCYVFDNNSIIDTFDGLTTLNSPKRPGLIFSDPYSDQILMDNGYCIKHCIDFFFSYAAVENGVNCRCGKENALQSYVKVDAKLSEEFCNKQCTYTTAGGVVSYPCGGINAYSVYKAETSNYILSENISLEDKLDSIYKLDKNRCIKDNQNCGNRALNSKCYSANNVEECINYCQKGNFLYAGLEAGFQCFCGNEYDSLGLRTGLEHCSSSCIGNSSQICGGSWALSIYDVPNVTPLPTLTPISSPASSSPNNNGLKIGLSVGIGIPFLIGAIAVGFLLFRNFRNSKYNDEFHQ
jgi:hypothetical protein